MGFELVLFDCDGVLIDSERIGNRTFAVTLNGLGASLTLEYMYEHFLGHTGLLRRFEGRIFTGREVARPKPAPDVYLHATRTMGVDPSACLVIEDTPVGAAAGFAAGMTVIGYAAHTPAYRLLAAGVHAVFRSMAELPGLMREIGESIRRRSDG